MFSGGIERDQGHEMVKQSTSKTFLFSQVFALRSGGLREEVSRRR